MSRWVERIKNNPIDRWWDASLRPGGFFDLRTYKGAFRSLLFWAAATYFLWHFEVFLVWLNESLGLESQFRPGRQAWSQIWAWIIGGGGMVLSLLALIVIPIRRSERITRYLASKGWVWPDDPSKSAQGQGYDDPNLTAKDLQGKEHDTDDAAKPRG
jgi:hypothetical protein